MNPRIQQKREITLTVPKSILLKDGSIDGGIKGWLSLYGDKNVEGLSLR